MTYYPHYILDASYIIQDESYGHVLCKVVLVDDELTHEDREGLLVEFAKAILKKRAALEGETQ